MKTPRSVACLFAASAVLLGVGSSPAGAAITRAPAGWTVDGVRVEPLDGAPLTVEGLGRYRGALDVRRSAGGLAVVNDVTFDDYLAGVSEMPPSWPAAALRAQAIAARTYA